MGHPGRAGATARAIDGLEQALHAAGLHDAALHLDLHRPQDYFTRLWSIAFRADSLAQQPGESVPSQQGPESLALIVRSG